MSRRWPTPPAGDGQTVPEPLPLVVILVLVALAFVGMAVGWRNRSRRQAHLTTAPVPADPGAVLASIELLYVATTVASEPLNRIAVGGLGLRSRATVQVTDRGVVLALPGRDAIFVPVDRLRGVGLGTFTIDRVVERDGLVVLGWELGTPGTLLDSYLRTSTETDRRELVAALQAILSSASSEGERR